MKRIVSLFLVLLLLLNPLLPIVGESWVGFAETESDLVLSPAEGTVTSMILGKGGMLQFSVENRSSENLFNLSLRVAIGNGLLPQAGLSIEGVAAEVIPLPEAATEWTTELEFIDIKDLAAGEIFSVSIPLESMLYSMEKQDGQWREGEELIAFGDRVPVSVVWLAGRSPQVVPGNQGTAVVENTMAMQVELAPVEVSFSGGGNLLKGAGETYEAADNAFTKTFSIHVKNNEALASAVNLQVKIPDGVEVSNFNESPAGYQVPEAGAATMNLVGEDGRALLDFGRQELAPGEEKIITFQTAIFNRYMKDGEVNAGELISHNDRLPLELEWQLVEPDLDPENPLLPTFAIKKNLVAKELILSESVTSTDDPIGYDSQLDYTVILRSNQYYGSRDLVVRSYLEGLLNGTQIGQSIIQDSVATSGSGYLGVDQSWLKLELESDLEDNPTGIVWRFQEADTAPYLIDGIMVMENAWEEINKRTPAYENNKNSLQAMQNFIVEHIGPYEIMEQRSKNNEFIDELNFIIIEAPSEAAAPINALIADIELWQEKIDGAQWVIDTLPSEEVNLELQVMASEKASGAVAVYQTALANADEPVQLFKNTVEQAVIAGEQAKSARETWNLDLVDIQMKQAVLSAYFSDQHVIRWNEALERLVEIDPENTRLYEEFLLWLTMDGGNESSRNHLGSLWDAYSLTAISEDASIHSAVENLHEQVGIDTARTGNGLEKSSVFRVDFSTRVLPHWVNPSSWQNMESPILAGDQLRNHATLEMSTRQGIIRQLDSRANADLKIPLATIRESVVDINDHLTYETVGDMAVIQVGDVITMEVVYDGSLIDAKQNIKEMFFVLPEGTEYVAETMNGIMNENDSAPAVVYQSETGEFSMEPKPVQVGEGTKLVYTYDILVKDLPLVVEGKEDFHLSKLILETQSNVQSDRDESQFYYSAPKFALNKEADVADLNNLKGGQVIPFTIAVENESRSAAYSVTVQDQLPNQLINPRNFTIDDVAVEPIINEFGVMTFSIESVPGATEAGNGEVVIQYDADIVNPVPAEHEFENTARLVSYQKQNRLEAPIYTDQPVGDSVAMIVTPFTVSKTVVDSTYLTTNGEPIINTVRPGDTVTYEIVIQMEQGVSAFDLTLKDTLPLGMDAVSFQRANGENWEPVEEVIQSDENNQNVYALSIGNPGSSTGSVTFTYRVTGTFRTAESYSKNQNKTNTAYVEWKTDPEGETAKSKTAAATQQVVIPDVRAINFLADRSKEKVDSKWYVTYDPTIVDMVEFTARYKNYGNDMAYNTEVEILIPTEYVLVEGSIPEGLSYHTESRLLTGTIAELAAGAIETFVFDVQSDPGAVTAGSNRELKASMIEFYNAHEKQYDRVRYNSIYLNQAPTASDAEKSTNEDQELIGSLERSDLNGDSLSYSVLTNLPASVGSFVFTEGNNWKFTPAQDYNEDDNEIVVQVTDAYGGVATATIVIDILDVNDPPIVNDQSFETNEETSIVNRAIVYSDVDSTAWTFELVGDPPESGSLTLREDGTFDYHPPTDFYGEVSFQVKVTDNGDGDDSTILEDEAIIKILVKNVQDSPELTGDAKETPEDTSVSGTVTAVDPDAEDTLTYTIETEPGHGSVTISKDSNGQASYIYTPHQDYHGVDRFQVRVSDGNGNSDFADVEITVTPVNDPPLMEDQSFETKEDMTITKGLIATDVDSDNLTFTIKQNVGENVGSLVLREDGSFDFTPEKDFHGTVQFQVTVSDQEDPALTDDATITIRVTPVNDPPVASDLWITIAEDTSTAGSVTARDVDGDSLTYELDADSLTDLKGRVEKTGLATEPTFTYTPKADDYGTEEFVMIVRDGKGGVAIATVTVQVTAVNDLPVTPDQSRSMDEDGDVIEGQLEITDVDPTDILTSSLSQAPLHGTATVATSGAWTYEPDPNWFGTETFGIRTDDGQTGSAVATVTITVRSVNDQPTTVNYRHATRQNLAVEGQVVAQDVDRWNHLFGEASDQLSFTIQADGEHGSATIDLRTGEWRYEPAHNYVGEDQFAVYIQDGHKGQTVSEITILVSGEDGGIYPSENQPPVTGNQTILLTEADFGRTVYGEVIGTDPNGDEVIYNLLENEGAIVELEGIGKFRLLHADTGQWELDVKADADLAKLPTFVSVKISDQRGGEAVARVYFAKEKPEHAMSGQLRDIESYGGEPTADQLIGGATVRLYNQSGDLMGQTTSALDGSFDFGEQAAGIYSFEIEKDGYSDKQHEFVFEGSGDEVIYLSPYGLSLVATPKTLVMDGRSIADLLATLTDLQGVPVADWTIAFEAVEQNGKSYGDYLDGSQVATDLKGQALTRFRAADIDSLETQVVALVIEAKTDGRLKAQDQILLIFEPSLVEGIVMDQETGEPVAGALVAIEEDLDGDGVPDYFADQVTGADGRYAIPIPLGNSRYTLSITKPMRIGDLTKRFTFRQNVDVGEITGTGDRFYAERTVSGILVERSSDGEEQIPEELSRYALEVFDAEGQIHGEVYAVLNPDGTFVLNGVEPGESYTIKPRIVFNGQTLYLPGIEVQVSKAGEIRIAEVLVDPFGTVTDKSTGEAIEGAKVTLYYADTARNRSAGRPIDQPLVLPDHPLALSDNENPQFTTLRGKYGYMVYPFTDYYLLVEADGYMDFDSRKTGAIAVEEEIVIYDIEMSKTGGFIPVEGTLEMALRAVSKTPRVVAGETAEIELEATNMSDRTISEVVIRSALPEGISPVIPVYLEGMRIRILDGELVITLYNVVPGETVTIPLSYRTSGEEANGRVVRMEYGITPLYGIKKTDQLNAQAGFLIIQPGQEGHHDRYLYGYPDQTVQPERAVSRAEAVAMVVRIMKLEGGALKTTVFDKELEGHWARNNIAVALDHGLIEGYLTGWFKPDQAMTRAEFSTLVARVIDLDRSGDAKAFWAENTMNRLLDYGLLKGDPDGSLRPDDPITRAEAVTILNRLLMRGPLEGIEPFYLDLRSDHWAYGDLVEATYNHDFEFVEGGESAKDHDLKKPIDE